MIIAIINQKGGVGKTTTTVNFGAALVEKGHRVLLVDVDPQRSLSHYDALEGEGLQVLAATPEELPALLKRETFDYALLDCPPALGYESAAALKVADRAIVPLQVEFSAWIGLANLLETIGVARQRVNPRLKFQILLTMSDGRSRHSREVEAITRKGHGDHVLQTVIRRSIVHADATAAGQSVLAYSPRSPAAELYRQLAVEIDRTEKANRSF